VTFSFVNLSLANQSNYVCLYLSVNLKECMFSMFVRDFEVLEELTFVCRRGQGSRVV